MDSKFAISTNTWTDAIEKNLLDIEQKCMGQKWMNLKAASRAEKQHSTLSYLTMFVAPIAGFLFNLDLDTAGANFMITLLAYLSGILSAVLKFSRLGDKKNIYKSLSGQYASLEGNIHRQLLLPREERVNPGKYLQWISTSYYSLNSSPYLIPEDIYKEWANCAQKNSLPVPEDNNKVVEKVDSVQPENIEIVIMGDGTMKKKKLNTPLTDPNFGDGRMQYELDRLKREK